MPARSVWDIIPADIGIVVDPVDYKTKVDIARFSSITAKYTLLTEVLRDRVEFCRPFEMISEEPDRDLGIIIRGDPARCQSQATLRQSHAVLPSVRLGPA